MKLHHFKLSMIVSLIPALCGFAQIQTLKPEVGKRMPDFSFSNVKNYNRNRVSLDDFKGKWLFIDFWKLSCSACIGSFPKLNELQKQFPEKVQFLLVGLNNQRNGKGIEKLFDRVSKNRNLKITAAFDSVLFRDWDIGSVPHIYIIDPEGILRFITGGRDLTSGKVRILLEGKEVSFYPKGADDSRPDFDVTGIFGSEQILGISILTRWNGEQQHSGYNIDRFEKFPRKEWGKGWSVTMATLFELYNYAYWGRNFWLPSDTAFYGKIWAFPILELRDSSLFNFDYKDDVGKGTYNYSLKIPDERVSLKAITNEMQRSLEYVFGYKPSIENREMPVWKLIAKRGAELKLRTKGGSPFFSGGNVVAGFTIRNHSMDEFLALATCNLPNEQRLAFINETGIPGNVDIRIDTDMTNYQDVREALQQYGMDLVKGKKEMKVLVLKNP